MNKVLRLFIFLGLLLVAFLLAVPVVGSSHALLFTTAAPSSIPVTGSTAEPIVRHPLLWISPAVPQALRDQAERWDIPLVDSPDFATLRLDIQPSGSGGTIWIYALVAPFPTVVDDVSFNDLKAAWKGLPSGPFAGRPLMMDELTLAAFTEVWGTPASGAVMSIPAGQLLDRAWEQRPAWAIVPFEALDPRWKVLAIDDQSPIHKDFQVSRYLLQTSIDYPLAIKYNLACSRPCPVSVLPVLPQSNREADKLTTMVMSGVTALVRATAYTMDIKGITYPGEDIRDLLRQADITHISNEIPFYGNCQPPDPNQSKLVFCSNPKYIELLNYVGADVVELTGNHFADFGPDAMLQTLSIYRKNNIAYFGGGANLQEARKPLLLENGDNKIAFIGCNSVDVGGIPTATDSRPGANPCDYDYMTSEIRILHSQGYNVITTFQYYETYVPKPFDKQVDDFELMAEAGASIVQGSQAHLPQIMEFDDGSFIHYGLGNLFFDQMGDTTNAPTRREFIDRHVFYDNHYISTELFTALLEDYSRPRLMTPEERSAFLSQYFSASGW